MDVPNTTKIKHHFFKVEFQLQWNGKLSYTREPSSSVISAAIKRVCSCIKPMCVKYSSNKKPTFMRGGGLLLAGVRHIDGVAAP